MEEFQEIANIKVGLLGNILLTIIGILIYNIAELMATNKVKHFKDFHFAIWWYDNQVRFSASILIVSCLFWLSYSYQLLTADKALLLGLVGNLIIAKLVKWIQNGKS